MLILNRRVGESIVINGNVTVQVTEICGKYIRLGIIAPKEVPVHRSEIQRSMVETGTLMPLGRKPA